MWSEGSSGVSPNLHTLFIVYYLGLLKQYEKQCFKLFGWRPLSLIFKQTLTESPCHLEEDAPYMGKGDRGPLR